jgi:hypothetical protein
MRFEGTAYRIVLSEPSTSQRTDKKRLLEVLGINETEFTTRFTYTVKTGWRLTCTALRKVAELAAAA